MTNKLISIIVGMVLVLSVGTVVYTTKKPILLPSEDNSGNQEAINSNTLNTKTLVPTNTSTKTSTNTNASTKKYESDDDEEENDDDGYKGGVATTPSTKPTTTTTPTAPTTTTGGGITLTTIAKHNSRTSCWSAVGNNVYDLTSWIPNHPGGEGAILSMCGIDGSSGYNGQHGGSSKVARILGGFKIGTLAI